MAIATRPAGISSHVEGDGYARARWRGGKRGQPPLLTRDMADCRLALRSITRALEVLEKAADESRPQLERDELHREGLALAAHAGRAIDDVVLRPHASLKRAKSTRP